MEGIVTMTGSPQGGPAQDNRAKADRVLWYVSTRMRQPGFEFKLGSLA